MSTSRDDHGEADDIRTSALTGSQRAEAVESKVTRTRPQRAQDVARDEQSSIAPASSHRMNYPSERPNLDQQDADEPEQDEEDEDTYPEPEQEANELLPPPDFHPFFTVIEDANGDHHHPSVHYIFADDDPDIFTDAALEAISTEHASDQRFVILDLAADGKEVVSISSLSPDWQALSTRTSPAPSWGGDGGKGATDRGLMLTITGRETQEGRATAKAKKKKAGSVDELLKAFDANLACLDDVLGTNATTIDTHNVA